ncbi:MAG: CoA-binding protein, partial [Gammaproteobacteria bacterium]|nr:CoA-binding protein [Gammaproteobacteria bacterium]
MVGASLSEPGSARADTSAAAIFREAQSDGRRSLNPEELDVLLAGLGMGATSPVTQPAVELRICLENTREFGLVISAGLGGLDGALADRNHGQDRVRVYASTELTDAKDFLLRFRRTLAYRKLAATSGRDGTSPPDAQLEAVFARLLDLARRQAAGHRGTEPVLEVLELDPVQVAGAVTAQVARCEFGAPVAGRLPRPIRKIDKLVHPASIGLIGVSASGMNFGRIILRNLMGSGYPRQQLRVIRPGATEVDGVQCVAGLQALDRKLDLLIVAVAADSVYGIVDEIIATDSAEAVMLIPGGLGETAASREPAALLAVRINAAHQGHGGGPIFLGANCLGVVSHPGSYDSWFIPLERLPKPSKKPERNSVLLSQSGAFMITRISQNPWLDPRYMLAVGNQIDLTHGDLMTYFADRPEIETV